MRILCLQHSTFDDPGVIRDWAYLRNYKLSIIKTYANETIPHISTFDFLIILGGTQSLLNNTDLNNLSEELNAIQKAIEENKLVLGICLGAQMIAASLSMKITKSPYAEIGVFPIYLTNAGKLDPIFRDFQPVFSVMHMHYDSIQLSSKARLLATSLGCQVQAFAIGNRTYGIQFHMEITNENIALRLEHIKDELDLGIYITTREELAKTDMSEINQSMFNLLDRISSL